MNWYPWLLLVHIAAAIVWLGASLTARLQIGAAGSADRERTARAIEVIEALPGPLFPVAAVTVLASGVTLVLTTTGYSFAQGWIIAALVLFVAIGFLGGGLSERQAIRVRTLAQAEDSDPAEYKTALGRLHVLSYVEVVLFALILYVMVFKPGL